MGNLTDKINQMIRAALENMRMTSASPGHINTFIDTQFATGIDIDADIPARGENPQSSTTARTTVQSEAAAIKEFGQLSRAQLGNVTSFARNPQAFIMGAVFRRFATGAAIAALVPALLGTVQSILDILMSPGHMLDRRLKILIDRRVQRFMNNQERTDIIMGKKTIRATAYPSPRGGLGVVGSNLDRLRRGEGMTLYSNPEAKGLFIRLN